MASPAGTELLCYWFNIIVSLFILSLLVLVILQYPPIEPISTEVSQAAITLLFLISCINILSSLISDLYSLKLLLSLSFSNTKSTLITPFLYS